MGGKEGQGVDRAQPHWRRVGGFRGGGSRPRTVARQIRIILKVAEPEGPTKTKKLKSSRDSFH